MSARQPVLFLSHGAPPLADDATWTGQLHDWSSRLDRPTSVLMVSAHWENHPARDAAGLRLLGVPAEVLRRHLRRPGRA